MLQFLVKYMRVSRKRNKPETGQAAAILRLARRRSVIRPKDLDEQDLPRMALMRLVRKGELQRLGRGLYALPGHSFSENHGLVLASASVPNSVVCLLSALRFHDVTTQNPSEIWLAVEGRAWRPRIAYPPLRVFRYSGPAFTSGVETHAIEGQRVRIYNLAKTIADLFKYRNKVGVDVAVEALREAVRSRRVKPSEIDPYARICRVQEVMRPYLEALAG